MVVEARLPFCCGGVRHSQLPRPSTPFAEGRARQSLVGLTDFAVRRRAGLCLRTSFRVPRGLDELSNNTDTGSPPSLPFHALPELNEGYENNVRRCPQDSFAENKHHKISFHISSPSASTSPSTMNRSPSSSKSDLVASLNPVPFVAALAT